MVGFQEETHDSASTQDSSIYSDKTVHVSSTAASYPVKVKVQLFQALAPPTL